MNVYVVKSLYVNESFDSEDTYTEDIFSTIEKATEYIKNAVPEYHIYTEDHGLAYDKDGLPRREMSDRRGMRTLTFYCECWEVK